MINRNASILRTSLVLALTLFPSLSFAHEPKPNTIVVTRPQLDENHHGGTYLAGISLNVEGHIIADPPEIPEGYHVHIDLKDEDGIIHHIGAPVYFDQNNYGFSYNISSIPSPGLGQPKTYTVIVTYHNSKCRSDADPFEFTIKIFQSGERRMAWPRLFSHGNSW